jgi:hypothetical protein
MGRVSGIWHLPFLDAAELPGCYECRSWFLEAWCGIQRWPGELTSGVEDGGCGRLGRLRLSQVSLDDMGLGVWKWRLWKGFQVAVVLESWSVFWFSVGLKVLP